MNLMHVLTSFAIAFGSSSVLVYGGRWFFQRQPKWPPETRWFWPFLVPLTLFLFILILQNQRSWASTAEQPNLRSWARVLLIVSAVWFLIAVVRVGKIYLFRVFDISAENNLENRMRRTQIQFLEKLLLVIFLIVGVGLSLLSFSAARELGTSFLASAGVASLVIGFASQKMVANLLAGFQIAFAQPIRMEDAVVINNEWGWIEDITLTYVVVRLWDLRRLIVPLSNLLETPFQNWTRSSAKIIGSVILQVDYRTSIDEMREELDRILARTPLWDKDVKSVQVVDSHAQTMEVRILISAANSPRAWDLRCFIRENMIRFLVAREQVQVGNVHVRFHDPPSSR